MPQNRRTVDTAVDDPAANGGRATEGRATGGTAPTRAVLLATGRPALRISHLVYGRTTVGHRVLYFLEPDAHGGQRPRKAIAEQVVLHRWRRRQRAGTQFAGARLSPHLWRAMATTFGHNAAHICTLSAESLRAQRVAAFDTLQQSHQRLPDASVLQALCNTCGPARLQALLDRHTEPALAPTYGVPDLFLYSRSLDDHAVHAGVFVEVKKPGEPLSRGQRQEITFLRKLGLQARVLELIER